ncbi:Rv3654c family TadE-like protein [Williamsia serinedens]|uniref:Helicase/secretion neighborhood TadE-like protein n=1 Tax=Williamsia serinedens TaxID=391736 RepID=A0ABT1H6I2_9NOCA|nr:Rv3654c family TadE-like protein [Williamsia serinedens]MCP2162213.1 helicase/secretion neighborhood TadE-like protein [Williamsia serinedens]
MRRLVDGDRGSVTVLGAFVVAALVGVIVLIVYLGAATAARHRAQNGADLAALAAAGRALLAEPDPCGAAREIGTANAVRVTDCTVDGSEVSVRTTVPIALGPFGSRDAHARARAGPTEDTG